jgi:hypothetical protein
MQVVARRGKLRQSRRGTACLAELWLGIASPGRAVHHEPPFFMEIEMTNDRLLRRLLELEMRRELEAVRRLPGSEVLAAWLEQRKRRPDELAEKL